LVAHFDHKYDLPAAPEAAFEEEPGKSRRELRDGGIGHALKEELP